MAADTITTLGVLYVVATPIGNLADITFRAVDTLKQVRLIAAEDTRHSARLLHRYGITTPLVSLHEHNEHERVDRLLERLLQGESVALISDAGTPLISDPGYRLVAEVRRRGIPVVPVPGPSAIIAALSVSGLPTDRFCFEGFLPAKPGARRARLQALRDEPRTLIFYESPHRICDTLRQMCEIFGSEREAVLARELTKRFETLRGGAIGELSAWVAGDRDQQKGELVLLVKGAGKRLPDQGLDVESARIADILGAELPPRQAAELTAKITGEKKNRLYRYIVDLDDR